MERKEFLAKLGISLAAVCAGCSMVSCGSTPKAEDPQPGNGGTGTGGNDNALFTVNLNNDLKAVGEFLVSNGVILVRLAQADDASSFTAVQVACTHQGVSIGYNNAQGKFICPAHGSEFSTQGAVLQGPAVLPLKEYEVTINGSTLSVTA